ncbi:hypothetical protein ACWD7C_12940 [Streptomyces sp. NPDC005134]|uniref:hypothetical protein n=1 Tax=unclassified Streptomyces TaxID=2593676 RepID=UPI0033AC0344
MPEFYPRIGDAIGAAMQHNIRLAHGGAASGSSTPLQIRHLPHPSADPHSVPGMIARLTETATPHEVAGIIEEVNGALVGALPQLTELVAAAADWTRARLTFKNPHHNPTFETWTRLAAATHMLRDVQEELEVAESMIAACPAELSGNCSAMSSAATRSRTPSHPPPTTRKQTGSAPPAPPPRTPPPGGPRPPPARHPDHRPAPRPGRRAPDDLGLTSTAAPFLEQELPR